MLQKKTSERSRLLADTGGYDSETYTTGPHPNISVTSTSVNNTCGDTSVIPDVESSDEGQSAPLTESTRSSRSRRRPKSLSVRSDEVDNYDIFVDAGEPGTT